MEHVENKVTGEADLIEHNYQQTEQSKPQRVLLWVFFTVYECHAKGEYLVRSWHVLLFEGIRIKKNRENWGKLPKENTENHQGVPHHTAVPWGWAISSKVWNSKDEVVIPKVYLGARWRKYFKEILDAPGQGA